MGKKNEGNSAGSEAKESKRTEEPKMITRPRRDSTSSLAAAMQVKAQKDTIGDTLSSGNAKKPIVRMDRDKETGNEAKKLQIKSPSKTVLSIEKEKDQGDYADEPPIEKEKAKEKVKEKDKEKVLCVD